MIAEDWEIINPPGSKRDFTIQDGGERPCCKVLNLGEFLNLKWFQNYLWLHIRHSDGAGHWDGTHTLVNAIPHKKWRPRSCKFKFYRDPSEILQYKMATVGHT